jgi:hypothetical protein
MSFGIWFWSMVFFLSFNQYFRNFSSCLCETLLFIENTNLSRTGHIENMFIENMFIENLSYRECDFDNIGYCVLENYLCSRKQVHIENFLYKKFRPDSGESYADSDEFSDDFRPFS